MESSLSPYFLPDLFTLWVGLRYFTFLACVEFWVFGAWRGMEKSRLGGRDLDLES